MLLFYLTLQRALAVGVSGLLKNSTTVTNKLKTTYLTGKVNSTQNPVQSDNELLKIVGDLLTIKDADNRVRVRLGNYDDEFAFIIYDKNKNRAIYFNQAGEGVFAGSIQTLKDCLIQGDLRVGMSGNNTKGIEFYGDSYEDNSECYGKMIPWVDAYDDKIKGINIEGNLWIEGKYVATETDVAKLENEIKKLKALIEG